MKLSAAFLTNIRQLTIVALTCVATASFVSCDQGRKKKAVPGEPDFAKQNAETKPDEDNLVVRPQISGNNGNLSNQDLNPKPPPTPPSKPNVMGMLMPLATQMLGGGGGGGLMSMLGGAGGGGGAGGLMSMLGGAGGGGGDLMGMFSGLLGGGGGAGGGDLMSMFSGLLGGGGGGTQLHGQGGFYLPPPVSDEQALETALDSAGIGG